VGFHRNAPGFIDKFDLLKAEILYKELSYKIVGIAMTVHRKLGLGFKEAVYKDALAFAFDKQDILYSREKSYRIFYDGVALAHRYVADFIIDEKIILEIKSSSGIHPEFITQTLNYLKASGLRLGIIICFGGTSLVYKRVIAPS
jgi:GxxExxY protein